MAIHQELNWCCDIYKYDEDGNLLLSSDLDGAAAPVGIAVDNQNRVFYQSYYYVERWKEGSSKPITSYGTEVTGVAVDPSSGTFYADFGGVKIGRYVFDGSERVTEPNGAPCAAECDPTSTLGVGEISNAGQMFVDPTQHELYVDQGNRILRFHGNGRRAAGPDIGAKVLSNSNSVAVGSNGLYATNAGSAGANVAAFGPLVLAPDPRTDNPMIIDSVNDAGTRHTGDFQITPDGNDGAFTTTTPLTGYTNAGHEEVFRYDSPSDAIDCASCNPTGARATGEASLARNGLSLTEDGRVFFNSTDPLVPSDLDNREDAYEWSEGKTSLISTGLSPFNSSLLSASADGNGRLLLHPRHAGASGPERKPGQDLRRPRKRRLRLHAAAGELQSLRRVPRRRQPGADPAGGRHDHRHRRQPHGGPEEMPPRQGPAGRPLREEENGTSPQASTRKEAVGRPRQGRTGMTAGISSTLRAFVVSLGLALLLIAISSVGTAQATEGIETFATETSTTDAGSHPDLHTTFTLKSPGLPEAAENVYVETPSGIFGNPNAVEPCTSVVFAQQECPPTSQVGLITIRARYEGNSNYLLGTAPIYNIEPSEAETALFAFIVPTLEHPDPDPGRRADRQRLRTELQSLRDHAGDAARGC